MKIDNIEKAEWLIQDRQHCIYRLAKLDEAACKLSISLNGATEWMDKQAVISCKPYIRQYYESRIREIELKLKQL